MNFPYTGPFLEIKVVGEINYLIQRHPHASPFTVHVDDLKHYYGNDSPIPWINGLGQPGHESGELPVIPQVQADVPPLSVVEGKEMPTPSSCDIAVSNIEDDKSATTSHPGT